jgi:hypothetical protein
MVLASWVERDGLARSVLVVLAMTTIACFSYTWGYYEVGAVTPGFSWFSLLVLGFIYKNPVPVFNPAGHPQCSDAAGYGDNAQRTGCSSSAVEGRKQHRNQEDPCFYPQQL